MSDYENEHLPLEYARALAEEHKARLVASARRRGEEPEEFDVERHACRLARGMVGDDEG